MTIKLAFKGAGYGVLPEMHPGRCNPRTRRCEKINQYEGNRGCLRKYQVIQSSGD